VIYMDIYGRSFIGLVLIFFFKLYAFILLTSCVDIMDSQEQYIMCYENPMIVCVLIELIISLDYYFMMSADTYITINCQQYSLLL